MANLPNHDLPKDTVALVLAFTRQDREALRALLSFYPGDEGRLRLMGSLASLVTLAIEDLIRLAGELDVEVTPGAAAGEATVEAALRRMAETMAAADG